MKLRTYIQTLMVAGIALSFCLQAKAGEHEEWKHEKIDVEQMLSNWGQWGHGHFGNFRDQAVQMQEAEDTKGMMLVSPDAYGQQVKVSYEAMTLRPATVLVLLLSASEAEDTQELRISEDYEGGLGKWLNNKSMYFSAFHNEPHSAKPFLRRANAGQMPMLEQADQYYMETGQWHDVEAGVDGTRIWLKIDGETVLDVTDYQPLEGGHLVFRIRGTGVEQASCLIKNVTISTPQ